MSDVDTRTETGLPPSLDDLDHICCCQDENMLLCGFDGTDQPWRDFDQPSCVVCAELEGFCPFGGTCGP